MKIDNLGRCIFDTNGAMEYLYKGVDIGSLNLDNETVTEFNNTIKKLKLNSSINDIEQIDKQSFDIRNQSNWYFPEEYKQIDIEKYVLDLVKTDIEKQRVLSELELYKKFNLYIVLKYLVYLVDIMRKNSIVWGVGRGSSVSSYVLFLIGIHKVDSIKYNLDINEFLR
tara:strand:- start:1290 stop:1793 length:504 start_codon:yes stop_codon:yes gene_type:complete